MVVFEYFKIRDRQRKAKCQLHELKIIHRLELDLDHVALRPQKRGCLLGTGTEGRGRESEGSTADTTRKRPERPWTAARTTGALRRCPLAIAQRLTSALRANCRCFNCRAWAESQGQCLLHALLLRNNLKRKKSNFCSPAPPPYS